MNSEWVNHFMVQFESWVQALLLAHSHTNMFCAAEQTEKQKLLGYRTHKYSCHMKLRLLNCSEFFLSNRAQTENKSKNGAQFDIVLGNFTRLEQLKCQFLKLVVQLRAHVVAVWSWSLRIRVPASAPTLAFESQRCSLFLSGQPRFCSWTGRWM